MKKVDLNFPLYYDEEDDCIRESNLNRRSITWCRSCDSTGIINEPEYIVLAANNFQKALDLLNDVITKDDISEISNKINDFLNKCDYNSNAV